VSLAFETTELKQHKFEIGHATMQIELSDGAQCVLREHAV